MEDNTRLRKDPTTDMGKHGIARHGENPARWEGRREGFREEEERGGGKSQTIQGLFDGVQVI